MNEERKDEFDVRLHDALAGKPENVPVPPFDEVFAAAGARLRRRRLAAGGFAAASLVALVLAATILPGLRDGLPDTADTSFVQIADVMETTQWPAPSDALLPSHEIDIYSDLPELIESTKPAEGALL